MGTTGPLVGPLPHVAENGHATGPWRSDAESVAGQFGVDPKEGLTVDEAAARLAAAGPNSLGGTTRRSGWSVLAGQFTNAMTVVLAGAVAVTIVIGDVKDAVVIGVIVVLNGLVGFVQEFRAERAMAALARMAGNDATVRRGGEAFDVPTDEIVSGDVVLVGAGDVVPADLRLVEVAALRINEAPLTGESEPVAKRTEALPELDGVVGERTNMAFRGTAVTYGRGVGVAVATGPDTELGQIAALLRSHAEVPTPLQRRLASLARRMAAAAIVVCGVIFGVGLARGEPVDTMFLTAVSLAVAAIPEGLPAVITVALALGARRMAQHHAIVRKLTAVETLGSVSVICTDKTGTLTQNRMAVERIWTPAGEYRVVGRGYEPSGQVTGPPIGDRDLARVATVAAVCNDATLRSPPAPGGDWDITGDPTEGALLALAGRLGADPDRVRRDLPRIEEIAFDATRRRMTTLNRRDGQVLVASKGALEAIAPALHHDDLARAASARDTAERWASEGLRVLALADGFMVDHPGDPEVDLHLAGLVGIADPPRSESAAAIAECREAGVETVIITGDHAVTAAAVAHRIGIPISPEEVVTGADLDEIDDDALARRIRRIRLYARVDPAQKLRIVDAWRSTGAVVAVTGDGVNDAPALRHADIGVAMGGTGTDVSKEAADMVLADDNFATIVHAVDEGRRIFDNIRRTVRYLITTNSGEVWVMFLAPLVGLPLPLLPVQILWINLVTDSLPAIALGLQAAEAETMHRPPRPANESLFSRGLWQHALTIGLLMAAVVLPLQAGTRAAGWHWQTMVFTTVAFLQLGHALAVRAERRAALRWRDAANPWLYAAVAVTVAAQIALVYTPTLQGVFGTQPLRLVELVVVAGASTIVFFAVELEKWIGRRRVSMVDSAQPS